MVESRGETLITVPFWWDGKKESIVATIRKRRSDLLTDIEVKCAPVPDSPPPEFLKVVQQIPGIGELMLASFPATTFFNSAFPNEVWWIGEKYDGVRSCWNSKLDKFYLLFQKFTRSGLEVVIPQIIVNSFVKNDLDGEIWFGRNLFYESQEFIQSASYPQNLEKFRVVCFDDPTAAPKGTLEYEKRILNLLTNIPPDHPFLAS